jgi:glycosyltransferase involved in cell wall biosynthesis
VTKLSIVIPTLGRPSLERALASCAGADEIIVALDHSRGIVKLPLKRLPLNARCIEGRWGVTGGHAGRVAGIKLATGTHLAFMDDDDVYNPGAIQLMREAACDRPVIFRMSHYMHGVLWREPVVEFGNVSTQMYVVPNDPARLGTWTPHKPSWREPGGDYTFIAECIEKMGEPIWREEIISTIRPQLHKPSIAIITPWHNHLELADDYFTAVNRRRPIDELLIVDCGSTPALPFATLRSDLNLGFVGGSNLGLEHATADVVLFLNNDVRLLRSHWLEEFRDEVESGVLVGSLRFDRHADFQGQSLPYIDGWCLAGMRDDLLELGGFDSQLQEPAYFSDNLLCLEARAAGMMLRDVRVGLSHLKNVTAGSAFEPTVQAATQANRAVYEARARELLAAV